MNKKRDERYSLSKFIRAYGEQIDPDNTFQILDRSTVQLKYPKYNGENPDFVVLHCNGYVGIELFELTKNTIDPLNLDPSERNQDIKNVAHLNAKRKRNGGVHRLYLMEDLGETAIERINEKIQVKLPNYIDCPIWLIGYVERPYNQSMLTSHFENANLPKVAEFIRERVVSHTRIQSIWLAQFSGRDLLLRIK